MQQMLRVARNFTLLFYQSNKDVKGCVNIFQRRKSFWCYICLKCLKSTFGGQITSIGNATSVNKYLEKTSGMRMTSFGPSTTIFLCFINCLTCWKINWIAKGLIGFQAVIIHIDEYFANRSPEDPQKGILQQYKEGLTNKIFCVLLLVDYCFNFEVVAFLGTLSSNYPAIVLVFCRRVFLAWA